MLQGDLGRSYFLNRPVTQALWERAEPTALLTLCALLVAVFIGVPAGLIAGASPGSAWDRVLMFGALLGVCIPGFWLSLNFIFLFAVRLGWLPAAGYASIWIDPRAAFTNTMPVDAYRGAGRPEATYVVERLVETAARENLLDQLQQQRASRVIARWISVSASGPSTSHLRSGERSITAAFSRHAQYSEIPPSLL